MTEILLKGSKTLTHPSMERKAIFLGCWKIHCLKKSKRLESTCIFGRGRTQNFLSLNIRSCIIHLFSPFSCMIRFWQNGDKIWLVRWFCEFMQHLNKVYGRPFEPCHDKTCFCHLRITKVHISLRIHTIWSAPLLFATPLLAKSKISRL